MSDEKMQQQNRTKSNFQELMNNFIIAIKSGIQEQVIQILENYGHQLVNKLEPQSRQPPIYFAALNADPEKAYNLMKILVEKGANPFFKDSYSQTVVFYICREGKIKCLKYLIELNVPIDEPDYYGQTPIYYSCRENKVEITKILINHGAKINRSDTIKHQTPLFYAARQGNTQLCALLIEYGADVGLRDQQNKTALHYAKKSNKSEVIQLLTKQMAKVQQNKNTLKRHDKSMSKEQQKKKKIKNKDNSIQITYKLVYTDQRGNKRDISQKQFQEISELFSDVYNYIKNPQLITQQQLQQFTNKRDRWDKTALKILMVCWKQKGANIFHLPVDPVAYQIEDYFQIVKRPMDLGTIKVKLTSNAYGNKQQFIEDMNLVFDNCVLYNGKQHDYGKLAIQLKKFFQQQCKLMSL